MGVENITKLSNSEVIKVTSPFENECIELEGFAFHVNNALEYNLIKDKTTDATTHPNIRLQNKRCARIFWIAI